MAGFPRAAGAPRPAQFRVLLLAVVVLVGGATLATSLLTAQGPAQQVYSIVSNKIQDYTAPMLTDALKSLAERALSGNATSWNSTLATMGREDPDGHLTEVEMAEEAAEEAAEQRLGAGDADNAEADEDDAQLDAEEDQGKAKKPDATTTTKKKKQEGEEGGEAAQGGEEGGSKGKGEGSKAGAGAEAGSEAGANADADADANADANAGASASSSSKPFASASGSSSSSSSSSVPTMASVNGTLAWIKRPLKPKGPIGQLGKVVTQGAAAAASAASAAAAAAIERAASSGPALPALSRELLERVACPGPFVVVTTTNYHFRHLADNWLRHLHEAGVPCTLVGALDARAAAWLEELGEAAFDVSASLPAGDLGWGSTNFHKLGRYLVHVIETVLESNVTVLLSDSDEVWLRDPRPFFERYARADALFSSDALSYTEQKGCGDPAKAIQPLDWTLGREEEEQEKTGDAKEGEENKAGDDKENKAGDGKVTKAGDDKETKEGDDKENKQGDEKPAGEKSAGGEPSSRRSLLRRRLLQRRSSKQQDGVVEATDKQGPEDKSVDLSAPPDESAKSGDAEGSSSSSSSASYCVEHVEPPRYRWEGALNIGIALYRPSALPLVRAWREALVKDDKAWDQNVLNDLVRADVSYEGEDGLFGGWGGRVHVGVLPVLLFCSGHVYFVQKAPQMRGLTPYAVHATFQYSGPVGKVHRFREAGLWSDQVNGERFDAKPGFLELDEPVPRALLRDARLAAERATGTLENTEPHFALVDHQLHTLRHAYAVASALSSRALVLPPMLCGQDRFWAPHKGTTPGSAFDLPFVCPADHVLDLDRWDAKAAGPSFREAGFLDRPAARGLASSRITLWVCKSREEALAERAKVQGDGDDAKEADEKLKLELACAGNPVQDDVLEEKKRQVAEVEEKKLRWWEDPYRNDPIYRAVDVASATYQGITTTFYDDKGDSQGDMVRVAPGQTLAQLARFAQVAESYAVVTVRPPGAIERLLAPTDAEAERIHQELLPLTSLWCCVKAHPGHVWYDPYYDVIPHTDRHGRVWNEPWKPTTGP